MNRFLPAVLIVLLFGLTSTPLYAATVTPVGVTLDQGTEFYLAGHLIDGAYATGNAANDSWVTDAPNGNDDYFLAASPAPEPVLIFDLGADTALDSILVWPYGVAGNSARDFGLRFATEAEGPGGFGASIALNPTFLAPTAPAALPGAYAFGQSVTARYVEMRITDNYFGDFAGGDRVGLSEVAFAEPGTALDILRQPDNQLVNQGGYAQFVSGAAGSAPIHYQWLKNGAEVSGATNAVLAFAAATAADSGSYTLSLSNSVGTLTSTAAQLLVNPTPLPVGGVTLVQSSAYFPVSDLVDAGGLASGANWVTDDPPPAGGDYFVDGGPEPIIVFDLNKPDNITRVAMGESVGTLITSTPAEGVPA